MVDRRLKRLQTRHEVERMAELDQNQVDEDKDGPWWILEYEGPSARANGYDHWVFFLDADDCATYGKGSVWSGSDWLEWLELDLDEPWEEPRIVLTVVSRTREELDELVDWEPF